MKPLAHSLFLPLVKREWRINPLQEIPRLRMVMTTTSNQSSNHDQRTMKFVIPRLSPLLHKPAWTRRL